MDFWNLMIKKDDWIMSFVFGLRAFLSRCNIRMWRLCREMSKKNLDGNGQELYIILNAPSLKTQDISVLKGKQMMFVNRGFMHPLYQTLQPTYHVFVDSKMKKGIWPVSWLDEIWKLSPQTTILLPVAWYSHPVFARYRQETRIYWMSESLPFYNLAVSGACFAFAIAKHFRTIYFTGFDATGIGYEMVKTADSHFYGNDQELENKKTTQFAVDLLMHSRHLHDLNRFAIYCRKRGYNLVNLTNGGLLDMFPRENILPLIDKF